MPLTPVDHPPRRFIAIHEALDAPPHAGELRGAFLAIGNFEGVHRGHRAVIAAAVNGARARRRPAAALTFEPHPRAFFKPDEPLFRLTDEAAKLRLFAATELDGAIVMKFDAALAALEPSQFIKQVLVDRLAIAGAAVGFDFHFGRGRSGTAAYLKEEGELRGFDVDIVPALLDDGRRISSGAVRAALAAGRADEAADLLGYPWFVAGKVVHGDRRGRELGFPTANLRLDPGCGLRHGVYAVRVQVEGRRFDGVANFGRRPMFDTGVVLLEVFLFDFAGDLYGRTLDVAVIAWIRPEFTFDTVDDLIRRMEEDCRIAQMALKRAGDAFPPLGAVG
ncbi:MAG TPA: bifunctional riboflavin kinase/FAD synthetase [Xanthobacteraceae bacterium]|nr:bifunctional riboflavin kinase/FAD synthetase [Xanthobacteraceae bacterium]